MDESQLSPRSTAENIPKAEVDDLLRRKRKVREHKACYPCRQRKVRCDLARPCRTCIEREHPQLCDYHPPSAKRQNLGNSGASDLKSEDGPSYSGNTVTLAQSDFQLLCRKLENVENTIEDLRREIRANGSGNGTANISINRTPLMSGGSSPNPLSGVNRMDPSSFTNAYTRHTSVHGFHAKNDLTGQTVHLGPSSVPALVMALGQGDREHATAQEVLGKSILPLFGLDNETATYPFVDLWGLANGSMAKADQLAKTIPTDSQCLSFFAFYRDVGHVVYPGVADIDGFEQDLTAFLMNRSTYRELETGEENAPLPGVTEQSLYDKDYNWIALLFAVLASGCQSSSLPRKERELTSQVYVCCSFECLRFTNFLSHATLETVQTLLVLGNVISNNMNAGTAWNLLGMTVRLAQSLGLHQVCPPQVPQEVKTGRSKIWWTLMWQDSLLSITYDRASSTALMDHSSMAAPYNHVNLPPFHSAMYRVCKVGLDVVRDRSKAILPRDQFNRIHKSREEIDVIMKSSADYLRDSRKCRSLRDSIEHWALYLHVSYITSELCRPAISPSSSDPELKKHFKQLCLDSLVSVVEAWLGLQNITSYARQSWASVHRALSSALLLGIMGEHTRNERCRRLLGRFAALMGDITGSVDPQELAAPMERAIAALRKLNISDRPIMPNPPMSHAPRFIEDIALGGTQHPHHQHPQHPTPDSTGGLPSPIVKMDPMAANMMYHARPQGPSSVASAPASDEESPYSVLNSILWGNGKSP